MRKGIAVSPGVAVGTAYCIHEIFVNPHSKRLADREITAELARYEAARDQVSHALRALQQKVERQVSREAGAIFGVHEAILRDAAFTNKVRNWIVNERAGRSTQPLGAVSWRSPRRGRPRRIEDATWWFSICAN